jgi:hypothetical protein
VSKTLVCMPREIVEEAESLVGKLPFSKSQPFGSFSGKPTGKWRRVGKYSLDGWHRHRCSCRRPAHHLSQLPTLPTGGWVDAYIETDVCATRDQ